VLVEGDPTLVLWEDDWTVATADGGWAAQQEHTVFITEHGADVLTR